MNRIFKTAASVSLNSSSYTTPAVSVVDVVTEGVLCASGDGQIETWNEETLKW